MTSEGNPTNSPVMELPVVDQDFLRELVKVSRQKHHHVKWVDRDGTDRVTTVSQTEVVRLNALAQRLRIGKTELMRQAAHLPAARKISAVSSHTKIDSAAISATNL
ncbi:MAG: hypothetical protein CK538_04710 [Opitutia bacterium]|nr:MAG: hypothetical protein CK538_04710 [Opitutae bacterium]